MNRTARVATIVLALAAGAILVSYLSVLNRHAARAPTGAAEGVAPAGPWRPIPQGETLTRIAFGSCLDQSKPQPILRDVIARKPQLFLMLGDNVYGDVKSADLAELRTAYRDLLAQPDFAAARSELAFLPTWDDHDYGRNDAGADFEHRAGAERVFREFWQLPRGRGDGPGIAYARSIGPVGKRVQIIMLDTRSFRSPLKRAAPGAALPGRYEPDADPSKTMLGEEQWRWLEGELAKPAEVRLLVSSVQVLSGGHGWERWGNLPLERERLLGLIERTRARGVILLSGDRHLAALYRVRLGTGEPVVEATSSSLNRPLLRPAADLRTPELESDLFTAENFGLIEIDWGRMEVAVSLIGLGGKELARRTATVAGGSRP